MKKAIITGASKGLGKALAYELIARDYEVLLIARSEKLLQEIANDLNTTSEKKVHCLGLDLSQLQSVSKIKDWCREHSFFPSVLINNAGFACWGYFDKLSLASQLELLQVNVQTPVALTYEMLPFLKQHPQAYVLNVCSTAAYQPVPTMTLYAASKSFVRFFSRGLRYELRDTNVSVTCLSPGPVATNFIEAAGMQPLQKDAKKVEMQPHEVARLGINAMFKNKAEVIPGVLNIISVRLSKIVPDFLLEKIASKLYESKLKFQISNKHSGS
jgi:short-subunit dehydrogenase